ncbi:MAG: hypothetical protein LBI68_08190 [Azoarcus sp.]|jgi:hypothetical protein|nr:hypothetical protein [Azoarcus sp.]
MANIFARRFALILAASSVLLFSACRTLYSNVSIGLDKSNYLRGEEIVVTIDGVTERMDNNKATLAIYAAGSGHGDRLDYAYLHVGDNQVLLPTPSRAGAYELRLYSKVPANDDTLAAKLPFTVNGDTEVSMSLDKTSYKRGEEIIATLDGVTSRMNKDSAFLAIYPAGGVHDSGYFYASYANIGEDRVEFSTPPEAGNYELRFYRKAKADEDTLALSLPFTVSGDVKISMKLNKKTYTQYEKIFVKLTGITNRMNKDGAFLVIYDEGAGHGNNFASVSQPAAGDSETTLYAPDESGTYEVRLYRKDSPRSAATLAATIPFTVKRVEPRR